MNNLLQLPSVLKKVSFILFLIIMAISFILTLFLPRHASFSDLFLKTTVIDDVNIME